LTIPPARPSSTAILALLALTVLSTSFAYLLYFFLLRNVGPTRTASVTYLVPVFGSLWGVVFLQEPFNSGMLLGLALILASVGLITRVQSGNRNPVQAPSVSNAGDT
jgi:drug/metabolite transporter (DMT)-like permease